MKTRAALFCGMLSVALGARAEPSEATYELVTVDASGPTTYFNDGRPPEHHPLPEWISTKLEVKKGPSADRLLDALNSFQTALT